uniref:Transposase MuDR plant domain-containing protein n=1 Tax=Lactuca sativa TaxID=4236 RepID=A0A9R1V4K6_LACSA|nr:hypothetical protein LSAT_V11C600322510 [Lactuca sativa]
MLVYCKGVVRVTNKGQVGSQATTSKRKGKELKIQKVTCGWYIHAFRSNPESDWFIRTLTQTHTCLQTRKLRGCTASLISKKIFDQVEANPNIPLRAIQDHFQKTYQVGVTMDNVFRAKDKARKHITGDYTKLHIHDNMRKGWRKTEYRDHFWKCALATTIPEFEHLMKEFSQYDKEAC